VHDLGDTMAVSFLQAAGAGRQDVFIVDVWRRAGDEWKLAIRYAAPASARDSAARGAPPIHKKY